MGYEYFDEEDVGEKKGGIGRGRKEEQIMKSHDQLIETPQNLNYLNTFLAKKFIEEKKAIQTTLFEVGKGSIGKVSGSRNSNRDKSNTSSGIFEQQPTMSGKKSKLKPSKSKVSNNAASKQKKNKRIIGLFKVFKRSKVAIVRIRARFLMRTNLICLKIVMQKERIMF